MRVMVVVPAFAERHHRDPEAVARIVAGLEAALAPEVRRRVDEPGAVQAVGRAEERAPQHIGPAAEREQRESDDDLRHPVPGGQRDVETILAEVGRVAREHLGVVVHRPAGHDPSHVRPVGAFARGVRIAFVIGMLMVNAVRRHPEDRSAFEGERAADCEEYIHPFRRLVAAMRQQAVIAHADAERAGDPPEENGAAIAPQLKKKNAATAPTWNAVMAMAVIQLVWPSEAFRP